MLVTLRVTKELYIPLGRIFYKGVIYQDDIIDDNVICNKGLYRF